ncbi:hypothetical protein [Paenibacillus dauci]|uniref:hypothetical protein n=1 Tax=Paenibacillus dauci TaxID=1567106 RepID=UPI0009E487E6|nr:hypothetical protein [Paenibacillus dauci]
MKYTRTGSEQGCKGCNRSPQLSEEKIERLVTIALQGKTVDELTNVEIQQQRFAQCMSCSSLQYGTTCKHCGCLVHIRTRLAASSCPSPYGSQWQS